MKTNLFLTITLGAWLGCTGAESRVLTEEMPVAQRALHTISLLADGHYDEAAASLNQLPSRYPWESADVTVLAKCGVQDALRLAVQAPAGINFVDNEGRSLLCWALEQHEDSLVRFLVSRNALFASPGQPGRPVPRYVCDYKGESAFCSIHKWVEDIQMVDVLRSHENVEAGVTDLVPTRFSCRGNPTTFWSSNSESVLQIVAHNKGDIYASDNNGYTLFWWALSNDYVELVKYLFERGVRVPLPKNPLRTPLHVAAESRSAVSLAFLLSTKEWDVDSPNEQGMTPLHEAAYRSHGPSVQVLLQHGADQNKQNYSGMTALHWAAKNGKSTDALIPLLEAGTADLSLIHGDKCGTTAGAAVCAFVFLQDENLSLDLLNMLISHGYKHRASHLGGFFYSSQHQLDALKMLMEHKALLEEDDEGAFAPALHPVCHSAEAVELFLDHGIAVDEVDEAGATCLHRAAAAGNVAVCHLLCSRGAGMEIRDANLRTPLHYAKIKGKEVCIDVLLQQVLMRQMRARREEAFQSVKYFLRYRGHDLNNIHGWFPEDVWHRLVYDTCDETAYNALCSVNLAHSWPLFQHQIRVLFADDERLAYLLARKIVVVWEEYLGLQDRTGRYYTLAQEGSTALDEAYNLIRRWFAAQDDECAAKKV